MRASSAPLDRANCTITTFSAYDVLLTPAIGDRSLRFHGARTARHSVIGGEYGRDDHDRWRRVAAHGTVRTRSARDGDPHSRDRAPAFGEHRFDALAHVGGVEAGEPHARGRVLESHEVARQRERDPVHGLHGLEDRRRQR